MPPDLYIVSDWVAYETSEVSAVLLDEAQARAVVAANESRWAAAKARGHTDGGTGQDVARWAWDGERYVEDATWRA